MARVKSALCAVLLVAACSGNPFLEDTVTGGDGDGGGIDGDGFPPGTENPTSKSDIVRHEELDESNGNGYAEGFRYNAADDEFEVDGLAFDGDNSYARGTAVGSLGPFAVYEGDAFTTDPVSGSPVPQFIHRALYGVDPSGDVKFAVVRTGSYVPYGFGGWTYQREGSVTVPTSGDATYTGDYAALRDFDGAGGLEYARGKMDIAIDFDDFNDGNGVSGQVYSREIFDLEGNDITSDVLSALNADNGTNLTALPVISLAVGPGATNSAGEMTGDLSSYTVKGGAATVFESGKYYAVLSGDNAAKVVGVIVVESDDPRYTGVTVRETGGFILARE